VGGEHDLVPNPLNVPFAAAEDVGQDSRHRGPECAPSLLHGLQEALHLAVGHQVDRDVRVQQIASAGVLTVVLAGVQPLAERLAAAAERLQHEERGRRLAEALRQQAPVPRPSDEHAARAQGQCHPVLRRIGELNGRVRFVEVLCAQVLGPVRAVLLLLAALRRVNPGGLQPGQVTQQFELAVEFRSVEERGWDLATHPRPAVVDPGVRSGRVHFASEVIHRIHLQR
jgi:hypothetical protein